MPHCLIKPCVQVNRFIDLANLVRTTAATHFSVPVKTQAEIHWTARSSKQVRDVVGSIDSISSPSGRPRQSNQSQYFRSIRIPGLHFREEKKHPLMEEFESDPPDCRKAEKRPTAATSPPHNSRPRRLKRHT